MTYNISNMKVNKFCFNELSNTMVNFIFKPYFFLKYCDCFETKDNIISVGADIHREWNMFILKF